MKFLIVLLVVSVAVAQQTSGSQGSPRQPKNVNTGSAPRTGAPAPQAIDPFKGVSPFGGFNQARLGVANNFVMPGFRRGDTNPYASEPRVWGPGLNNPYARPHSILSMNRALRIVKSNPNVLAMVDIDGEIELTDRFGREVEHLYNAYGQDLSDTLEGNDYYPYY